MVVAADMGHCDAADAGVVLQEDVHDWAQASKRSLSFWSNLLFIAAVAATVVAAVGCCW